MPIRPIDREPIPYVRPAYEPDTRTLAQLMALAGQSRAQQIGRRGQARAEGLMTLGQLISQGLGSIRQGREAKEIAELKAQEQREAANKPVAVGGRLIRPMSGEVVYEPPPEPEKPFEVGGALVDRSGNVIYEAPQKPPEGFSLSPGQSRFDGSGKPVASVPAVEPREPNPTEASLALLAARGDQGAARALERLRSLRAPQGERNPIAVMGPDGNPIYVRPEQALGQRPPTSREQPTEDERKSAGFFKQMEEAMAIMDETEGELTPKDLYQIQTLPQEDLIGAVNRGEMSEAAKRYLRAFEQFTEARMRPVSGAAISDSEFARDRRTYAKQYGETPKLAQDRKAARSSALSSLRSRASRALPKDSGGGNVTMIAPNGQEQSVPASMVEHYKSLGAKVKGQ